MDHLENTSMSQVLSEEIDDSSLSREMAGGYRHASEIGGEEKSILGCRLPGQTRKLGCDYNVDNVVDERQESLTTGCDSVMETEGVSPTEDTIDGSLEVTGHNPSDEHSEFFLEEERRLEIDEIVLQPTETYGCAEKPIGKLTFVSTKQATCMFKAYHKYLRAVDDYDRPKIITDVLREEFQGQYRFVCVTKELIDAENNLYTCVSFRHDFSRKSFYLKAHKIPTGSGECPDVITFAFEEISREAVVEDEISHLNSRFWFQLELSPFQMFASLAHREYCLSIEEHPHPVLLRAKNSKDIPDSCRVEIVEVKPEPTMPSIYRRFLDFMESFSKVSMGLD